MAKKRKKASATRGNELVAQGRTLAHKSRNSKTLSKKSKLKAAKASASRLVKGTIEKNRAKGKK